MSAEQKPKKYVASCSFGKDSLASVILAHEHGEPLDEIIYCEVMFSKEISGEVPEHRDFIYNTAIPKLEAWGYKVTVIRGEVTYLDSFNHLLVRGKSQGMKRGFPSFVGCSIQRDCKTRPLERYRKAQIGKNVEQYIGIAIDEPERLKRLEGTNRVSLLQKYNYTEEMARKLCEDHGLLSPIYGFARRNGCWFCPNAGPTELRHLYQNHRELVEWLIKLEHSENLQPRGGTIQPRRNPDASLRAVLLGSGTNDNIRFSGGEKLMQIITGEATEALRLLPSGCCSTCVTSPPYYGLRNYGEDGQIGLEETLEEYTRRLVEVFKEVRRALKDDGTLWLNIGDSYAGKAAAGEVKRKDLNGIPWLLAFALRSDGWYLRADIIWHKSNAMPESAKDRPTRAHEYIFLLSKSPDYFYNAEAIKEPAVGFPGSENPNARRRGNTKTFRGGNAYTHDQAAENSASVERESHGLAPNETGKRNRRTVWTIATRPYKGAHFATFPEELVRPCILAGSRPGDTVLDPFCGSGTTGAVAIQEGRDFIGIEINPEYSKMSEQRIRTAAQEGATP